MGLPQPKEFVGVDFVDALKQVRGGEAGFQAVGPDQFYAAPTPAELLEIYSKGFQGINPSLVTPEARTKHKTFFASMPKLYDIFPWAKGIGKGKVGVAYLGALHHSPGWGGDEAQTRGSCTVHGTGNAAECDHGNDALFGETQYKGRLVKENIYRSRGYNGDGWSCEAPCYYIGPEGDGGLLYRKLYTNPANSADSVDFTTFSSATENWAGKGSSGVPSWLEAESRKNKAKWIIPIQTIEEYMDAIYLGFGVNVCSGQGFSSTTDEFGVANAQGSWSHSMAHTAYNDTEWANRLYKAMIGMIMQSWGKWNKQNGKPEGSPTMPTAAFYARSATIASMLRGSDSFAVCGVWGWDRTGWEAFDVSELLTHLRNSTTQDYYKVRSERSAEGVSKALAEGFLAI